MAERKTDLLKRMPIFSRCAKAELEHLARNTDEIDVEPGRTLIAQGQPNHTFYIVSAGELDVMVDGNQIDRLAPGDFFGEITMIAPGPATATVVTKTPVQVLVMSHAQFQNAIRADEMIALRVMAVMAERLLRLGWRGHRVESPSGTSGA